MGLREDKLSELSRLRKLDELKALREQNNPKPAMTSIESGISGLADGLTFGHSDEIGAAMVAGVTAPFKDETFSELYDQNLKEHRAHKGKAKADNGWSYAGGNVAGTIVSPVSKVLAPAKGASVLAAMGRGAAGGAILGAGQSTARFTDSPDKAGDFAGDVLGGAALGGVLGGAFNKAGQAVSSLNPDRLRQAAGDRAVKAATGQNLRAIKTMRATGAADDNGGNALDLAGRNMLKADDAGPAVVGWTSRAESILPQSVMKQKFFGEEIGKVADAIDDAMPGAIDGRHIGQRIREYASQIPQTEQTMPVIKRLMREAARADNKGNMSFKEAQALKGTFKFKPQDSTTHTFGQEGSNKLNSIFRDEMNQSAKMISEMAENGTAVKNLASRYGDFKGKYQTYKNVSEAAQKRVDANLSNRFASPSDYGSAGLGVMAAMAHGGGATTAAVGLAAGLANKISRERGSAFAANGMSKLATILEKSPQALGKFGKLLDSAANRGEGALVVTHQMLMKNEPAYRAVVEGAP